jgi:hypothetical protein
MSRLMSMSSAMERQDNLSSGSTRRPELIWAVGMKHADVRKCMRLVEENRETLLAYWDEIHG